MSVIIHRREHRGRRVAHEINEFLYIFQEGVNQSFTEPALTMDLL